MCLNCYKGRTQDALETLKCKVESCDRMVSILNRTGFCRTCYQRTYNSIKAKRELGVSEHFHDFSSLGEHWKMPVGKPFKFVPDYKTDTVSKGE